MITYQSLSDLEYIQQHREIWKARPELREVYKGWFEDLMKHTSGLEPVVEVGSGPGFFKEFLPLLISTDVLPGNWIDVVCDACDLPFGSNTIGAIVMVDTFHHMSKPLDFITESNRVLRPGGRLAMIEPWISPLSYILYRYFHQEDCDLSIDINDPFGNQSPDSRKNAFDGNAAIPYKFFKQYENGFQALRLIEAQPFLGLPYLATFGYKVKRPLPFKLSAFARFCERLMGPLGRSGATRVRMVWEKSGAVVTPA